MYGCELWNNLSANDIKTLEVAHRFCVKLAQRLPPRIRTDMCTALVALPDISSYIDYRKLLLRLMNVDNTKTVEHVFEMRILDLRDQRHKLTGFMPDIVNILDIYDLTNVLSQARINGTRW